MKRFLVALLLVFSVHCAFAAGPSVPISMFGTPEITGLAPDPLSVTSSSPSLTTISMVNPAIEITNENLDFQSCQVATLLGEPVVSEPGAPAVPRVTRLYRVPELGSIELAIRAAEFDVIENYNAFPFPIEEAGSMRYERDPAFYRQDAWYPENVAEISEPMIFRDFRTVTVTLNPVQVNPVTHQARVYHNISVDIVASDQPGLNELTRPHRPSGAYASLYRGSILNLEDSALDDETTTPGTYLIVARDNATLNPWVDSLVEWRTRCGFDVVLRRFTALPTSLQVKNTIQEVFDNSVPPLEHVCIVGDPQGNFAIPTNSNSGMDHYYARLAGNDIIPDVSIGRISVSDQSQMSTTWRKLVAYEREPLIDSTGWFSKSLLYAIVGMQQPTNLLVTQWADQQLREFTGIQNNTISFATGQANAQFIQNQFNSGISLFLYAGYWIGTLQDISSSCLSGSRLPVCVLMAGGTGYFENNFSLAEAFTFAGTPTSPRGGVAAIGYLGADENGPFFRTFGVGFIRGISSLQLDRVGLCQMAGFLTLHETYGGNNQIYTQRLPHVNLMGDPALRMWTDIPTTLSVVHPTAIAIGAREFQVTVSESMTGMPIPDALVVAQIQNESPIRVLTDSAGFARLPVAIDNLGTLKLTVTKHNCKPFLADVPCQSADLMVSIDALIIDDDNIGETSGNNNHEFNPGEVIDLDIVLENFGTTIEGTNISAELVSPSPEVQVINSISGYPNLQPGQQSVGLTAFRIHVSPNMQDESSTMLELHVTASNEENISAIPVLCHAGDAEFVSYEILALPWDPGTSRDVILTIANLGTLPMSGVTGELISRDSSVTVLDNGGVFGDIQVGGSATNAPDVFTVAASSLTPRGHQAQMRLIIETATGFHDSVDFSMACGAAAPIDPAGPDAFGYYAFDDIDTAYDSHPTFEYLDLSTGGIGEDLNLNDPGEKTDHTVIYSVVRELPFQFTYYGQTFDTITICSNGWIAFGNESWCDEPFDRSIPAVMAPQNMVAIYWDDLRTSSTGDGVWVYFDHTISAYVIQWRATGGGVAYNQAELDFEIMILDPAVYPSNDENDKLVFLYRDVTMNLGAVDQSEDIGGCTIGIQDHSGTKGLQLVHRNQYAPGVAEITDGRVILLQTDIRPLRGNLEGYVTDIQTGAPFPNAVVSLLGTSRQESTDAQGFYRINDVMVGTYTAIAHSAGYNDAVASEIEIINDSTLTVNFDLLHPEFETSRDTIRESLVDGPTMQTSFEISNAGNGPLDYGIEIVFTNNGEPVRPWESLGHINITDLTQDTRILGCEFANENWYATGSNGTNGDNFVHVFDRDGNYIRSFPQPSVDPIGMYDLAWDGQYLYGSESGTGILQGFNFNGNDQASVACTAVNPARAIAYDPATDHFWVADLTSDIYEIDRSGNWISSIENADAIPISGLAWRPDEPNGYKLYALSQNNSVALWRIHPATHAFEFVRQLAGNASDQAAGCAITTDWNNALWTLGAVLQNQAGDRLEVFNMGLRSSWITVTPINATVGGGQTQTVALSFDGSHLRPDQYHVSLLIACPVLERIFERPVELTVIYDSAPSSDYPELPARYALFQNFPNPFNSATTISYDLKIAGHTALNIYNITGQIVESLVDEDQLAGNHKVVFNNPSLPSGLYFARLTSGDFTKTTKMILLK